MLDYGVFFLKFVWSLGATVWEGLDSGRMEGGKKKQQNYHSAIKEIDFFFPSVLMNHCIAMPIVQDSKKYAIKINISLQEE